MKTICNQITNNSIDFEEFSEWISNDEEIQDFLVENIQYQTRTHALNIYKDYYEKYIKCFPNYESIKDKMEKQEEALENGEELKEKHPEKFM